MIKEGKGNMNLLKNIADHKTMNDPKICFMLMTLIHSLNIKTEEELKEYEKNNFTFPSSNKVLNDEEIAKSMFDSFVSDVTHFDYLSVEDESELKDLYDKYLKTTEIDDKYIILIKIYSILDWGVHIPYHAYKYILEDRL